jgi:hypothetical protein
MREIIYIKRAELYDDCGWPLSPLAEEGYDIMGFPVSRIVNVIIDGEIMFKKINSNDRKK